MSGQIGCPEGYPFHSHPHSHLQLHGETKLHTLKATSAAVHTLMYECMSGGTRWCM